MATADRARDRARRQAERLLRELGSELRDARLAAGLSQRHVAQAAGLNQSRVSRTERNARLPARVDELTAHCAALGLSLSVRVYPEASPVRDIGQLRLLERFRARLPAGVGWRTEVPVGGTGDLRAWDARLDLPATVGVDAETRLTDIQALQRRCETKWRDSHVDRVVLLDRIHTPQQAGAGRASGGAPLHLPCGYGRGHGRAPPRSTAGRQRHRHPVTRMATLPPRTFRR